MSKKLKTMKDGSKKTINELVTELFKEFENVEFENENISFHFNNSGVPFFNLTLESFGGDATFEIKYKPPVNHYKHLLTSYFNQNDIAEILEKQFTEQGKDLAGQEHIIDAIQKNLAETHYAIVGLDLQFLIKAFQTVFEQSIEDVNNLWLELKKLNAARMNSHITAIYKQKRRSSPDFSLKKVVGEHANLYADHQRKISKNTFLKAASILPPDVPAPKMLFAKFYDQLLPQWKEAKKLYRAIKNQPKWIEMLSGVFPEFPIDLIGKLSSLDKQEKMPSEIALIHAAKICDLGELSRSTLNSVLMDSRKWIANAAVEEIAEIAQEYNLPDISNLNKIDHNFNGMM